MYVKNPEERGPSVNTQVQIYKEDDLEKAKLEVLSKTNMVDLAMKVYKKLYKVDSVPSGMFADDNPLYDTTQQTQPTNMQIPPTKNCFKSHYIKPS